MTNEIMTIEEAINALIGLKDYYNDENEDSYIGFDDADNKALDMAIRALEQQPCDEEVPNCTECRYYDKEKHYCPRFCRVIEDTMAEITLEQTRPKGKWVEQNDTSKHHFGWFYCSNCGAYLMSADGANYCSCCGAEMEDSND